MLICASAYIAYETELLLPRVPAGSWFSDRGATAGWTTTGRRSFLAMGIPLALLRVGGEPRAGGGGAYMAIAIPILGARGHAHVLARGHARRSSRSRHAHDVDPGAEQGGSSTLVAYAMPACAFVLVASTGKEIRGAVRVPSGKQEADATL